MQTVGGCCKVVVRTDETQVVWLMKGLFGKVPVHIGGTTQPAANGATPQQTQRDGKREIEGFHGVHWRVMKLSIIYPLIVALND